MNFNDERNSSLYFLLLILTNINTIFIRARIIVYNTTSNPPTYGAYSIEGFAYKDVSDRGTFMDYGSDASLSVIYGSGITKAEFTRATETQPTIGLIFSQNANNNVKIFYSYDVFN